MVKEESSSGMVGKVAAAGRDVFNEGALGWVKCQLDFHDFWPIYGNFCAIYVINGGR